MSSQNKTALGQPPVDTYSHYTSVVDNYHHYRPRYPKQLFAWLTTECQLNPTHIIADVGAGTGQLTELLLQNNNLVYGIEPNPEMRLTAEDSLRAYPTYVSVNGTAEETKLPSQSVDFVTVGNAFHWFNHARTRQEFSRILKPQGQVILAWNLECHNGTPLANAFEAFWQKYLDPNAHFARFGERKTPAYLQQFFGTQLKQINLANYQVCVYEALKGLILSMMKAPKPEDPQYPMMLTELREIFEQHQVAGTVTLAYDTAIFYGHLEETYVPSK